MHSSPTLPPTPFPTVLATCGTNITCPAPTSTEAKYNPVTGFTNFTGWYDGLGDDLCCNLCSETTHREGYFSVDADEGADIVFAPGEFDYLIFDQIWLPQWCAALQEGHDPTLSHPVGTLCVPSVEIPANNKYVLFSSLRSFTQRYSSTLATDLASTVYGLAITTARFFHAALLLSPVCVRMFRMRSLTYTIALSLALAWLCQVTFPP